MSDQSIEALGPISAALREYQTLATTGVMSQLITLEAQLGTAVNGSQVLQASDTYVVPNDSALLLKDFRTTWRSADISAETDPNAILLGLDMDSLIRVRLGSVVMTLQVKDKQLPMMGDRALPMMAAYKEPIILPTVGPLLLPPGIVLKASFANAVQGVTSGIGPSGFFGVVLSGVAIPYRV